MSKENGALEGTVSEPAPLNLSAGIPTTEQVIADLRGFYAATLEYPPEMVTPDADMESDLGVDSMQQSELLVRVAARYGLEPEDVNPGFYVTLADVANYVIDRLKSASHT